MKIVDWDYGNYSKNTINIVQEWTTYFSLTEEMN